jgi:thioredoxin 1
MRRILTTLLFVTLAGSLAVGGMIVGCSSSARITEAERPILMESPAVETFSENPPAAEPLLVESAPLDPAPVPAFTPPIEKKENNMATVSYHPGKVQHANEESFSQQVLRADVPVLVDFYADWCGPCQRLGPTLDEIARETPNARVVKVNVEDSPRLAARYGVDSIPSLKVFKNGEVVAEHIGLASKPQLQALLRH